MLAGLLACAVLGLTVLVAAAGSYLVTAHQARAAADLAALAGARRYAAGGDPCTVARRVASDNASTLRDCQIIGSGRQFAVTVTVERTSGLRVPGLPSVVTVEAHAGTPAAR